MFPQGVEVEVFVVSGLGLPTAIDDTDPFERQGTDGGMMPCASTALEVIVGFCHGKDLPESDNFVLLSGALV